MTKTNLPLYGYYLFRLYGSVTERIKHDASGVLTCREKSSNPVRDRFFITQASQP